MMIDRALRQPLYVVFAILLIALVLSLVFTIVPETRQGVLMRFNQPTAVINRTIEGQAFGDTGAGLIARVPFVDQIVWMDKRVQSLSVDNQQVQTADFVPLVIDVAAQVQIVNPVRATAVGSSDTLLAARLGPMLATALRNEFRRWPARVALAGDGPVAARALAAFNREANKLGIVVRGVDIRRAELPDGPTLTAALDRMRAAKEREAQTVRANGVNAAQLIQASAEADVARIYADAYSKDPGFYDFYRAMQSYRLTLVSPEGGTKPPATILLSPDNGYLKEFSGGK